MKFTTKIYYTEPRLQPGPSTTRTHVNLDCAIEAEIAEANGAANWRHEQVVLTVIDKEADFADFTFSFFDEQTKMVSQQGFGTIQRVE